MRLPCPDFTGFNCNADTAGCPVFSGNHAGSSEQDWALVIIPGWYLYNYGFSLSTSNLLRWARVSLPSIAAYLLITQVYLPHTAISVIIQELEAVLPESDQYAFDFYLRELRLLGISFWTQSVFSPAFYQFAGRFLRLLWLAHGSLPETGTFFLCTIC